MNIWKEALNEFNKRCDEQESCVFLCPMQLFVH